MSKLLPRIRKHRDDWWSFPELSNLLGDFYPAREKELMKNFDFSPSCEVKENKNDFYIRFDLPGVKKDNIKLEIDENRLTVSGDRREEKTEGEEGKSHFSEVYYGSFTRSFTLPASIDAEKVTADYEDGVLKVSVPKAQPNRTREIPVR